MSKEKIQLKVEKREGKGTGVSRRIRRANKIPGVIYSKGKEASCISLDVTEWKKLYGRDVKLVDLNIDGGVTKALIKEVQEDYLKGAVLHIDFQEIRMDEILTAAVAVHAKPGTTPVGLAKGGILEQPMHEIEVSCLPADLPDSLEVDIGKLDIDDALHVRDIVLPQGVKAAMDPDLIVFHVTMAAAEAAAETAAAAAGEAAPAASPEVITEKQKEERAEAKKEKEKGGEK